MDKTSKMICFPDFRSLKDPNTRDKKLEACKVHTVKDACVSPCKWNEELNSNYEFNGLVQLVGEDPTKTNELTKDQFLKASNVVRPSKVYFAEATKSSGGLKASRQEFIKFKNYLDNVGDTQCTINFGKYSSESPKSAFDINTKCRSHANQTSCAESVCIWRGDIKDCESFQTKDECPTGRCSFINQACSAAQACNLTNAEPVWLNMKARTRQQSEIFTGELEFA